jgi:hypothetical protein
LCKNNKCFSISFPKVAAKPPFLQEHSKSDVHPGCSKTADWTGLDWNNPRISKARIFYFTFDYLGTSSPFTLTHTAYFYTDNNTWLQGLRESPSVWSAICVFISLLLLAYQGKQDD